MKDWLLQKKINFLLITAFLVCSLLISLIHISFQNRRIETVTPKITLLLHTLVERDRRALANEIFENRIRAVRLRVEQMSTVEGILAIVIYNKAGSSIFEYTIPGMTGVMDTTLSEELILKLSDDAFFRHEHFRKKTALAYYHTISAIDEVLGYIKIYYSLADIEMERNFSIILLSFQLIILFLILFVINKIFISRSIVKPLKHLEQVIGTFQYGKKSAKARVYNNDEIGTLSRTFNTMSSALFKAQNYILNIINSMPSVVIGLDSEGCVTHWNKKAELFTKISASNAYGRGLFDLLPYLKADMGEINESIQNKEIKHIPKKVRETETGTHYEDVTIYPLISNGVEGIVIRIDDVTKEYELEEQLHHSRKMEAVGQLAGGIAHDFNNLLGGIMSAAESLKSREKQLDKKSIKCIDLILQAVMQSADLITKLLTFSRKGRKVSESLDIHKVIDDTVSILTRTIDKKITIRVEKNANVSHITGDSADLQNIFINLGVNSSHAMPHGGTLTIQTKNKTIDTAYCNKSSFKIKPGCYIEIKVSDTGCGIEQENLNKIFEPFFTTREIGKGTGLGLATVYGTVQEHHGAISVSSEKGKYTSFTMMFPCMGKNKKAAILPKKIITGTGRILFVDDEEILRISGEIILKRMGYRVMLAENGEEAVNIYRENHDAIDLVILDMIMPRMNGYEAFKKMKEIDNTCKVIISTGFMNNKDLEKIKESGLAGIIHKPYKHYELNEVIAGALQQSH